MSAVIENLKMFNRKERFYLILAALGENKQTFQLGWEFRERLGKFLGLSIPCGAFAAMDYHLDWILLSIYLAAHPGQSSDKKINIDEDSRFAEVNQSQQDIDFLIAFEASDRSKTHLVLIEAKGDTSWSNDQIKRKVKRLKEIFDQRYRSSKLVTPHLVLMSPKRPEHVVFRGWPDWMLDPDTGRPRWLPLELPEGLCKPTRVDPTGTKGQYRKLQIDSAS